MGLKYLLCTSNPPSTGPTRSLRVVWATAVPSAVAAVAEPLSQLNSFSTVDGQDLRQSQNSSGKISCVWIGSNPSKELKSGQNASKYMHENYGQNQERFFAKVFWENKFFTQEQPTTGGSWLGKCALQLSCRFASSVQISQNHHHCPNHCDFSNHTLTASDHHLLIPFIHRHFASRILAVVLNKINSNFVCFGLD